MLVVIAIVFLIITSFAAPLHIMGEIGGALVDHDEVATIIGSILAALGFLLASAYGILVVSPMKFGVSYTYLRAARNDPLDLTDLFEVFRNYINVVLAGLVITLIVGLVIPGIFLACKFVFVPYIIIDRRMNVVDALHESWDMTHGHVLDIILIWLLGIPIVIAGLASLVIGVIPAKMLIELAFASLYHAVSIDDEIDASMY